MRRYGLHLNKNYLIRLSGICKYNIKLVGIRQGHECFLMLKYFICESLI
nr:MAG TPA: hypothetical protein [Caudoviricetes sp.]